MIDIATNDTTAKADVGHGISFDEAFRVWLRVAILSFGGPAGQIAVMHRILVDEKHWISEGRFLHALNYCHLLLASSLAGVVLQLAGKCKPMAAYRFGSLRVTLFRPDESGLMSMIG